MSIAAELKRRLETEDRHISKRLKLAENVLAYPFLPLLQKEEIVIDWLCVNLEKCNDESGSQNLITTLERCAKLLNFKTFSAQGKNRLFTIVSKLLLNEDESINKNNVLKCCLNILENNSAISYFQQAPAELFMIFQKIFVFIRKAYLKEKQDETSKSVIQESEVKRIFYHLHAFIKSCNKKSTLLNPFIQTDLFTTILKFSDTQHSSKVYNICQLIMFPTGLSALFRSYLIALVKGSDLMTLFEEKGEALRPIVTVMDILFKYSPSPSFNNNDLITFLGYFINSYKFDENLIFVFNAILYKCIGIDQNYIEIHGVVNNLKLKREYAELVHLQNLNYLSEYNINLNVVSTFTPTDVEKKNFLKFLQCITHVICDDKSIDSISLLIVKQTVLLDPEILLSDLYVFLPKIIVQKKAKAIISDYDDVLITIMEVMFKMSKGPEFVINTLTNIKSKLEEVDSDQQKLLNKKEKLLSKRESTEKVDEDLLFAEDLFSNCFYEKFAKLGSDLMSWQHIDLFKQLIDLLNEKCINELESSVKSPSTILFTEIMCSFLLSLCNYSKTADHNLPNTIYEKFYACFETYGMESLSRLATVILKYSDNVRLLQTFLKICQSYGNLKLLLSQFQPHFKFESHDKDANHKYHISDITMLHSYISSSVWKNIYKSVNKINDKNCINIMNVLILQNVVVDIYATNEGRSSDSTLWNDCVKKHVLNNFNSFLSVIEDEEIYFNVIFSNINESDMMILSDKIIDSILNDEIENNIIEKKLFRENKKILSAITMESARRIIFSYESNGKLKKYSSLYEKSKEENFNIKEFLNLNNFSKYVAALIDCNIFASNDNVNVEKMFKLLTIIPVQFLNEDIQNFVMFSIFIVLMSLLRIDNLNKPLKRIRDNCSSILLKMFDLSFKLPKIFNVLPLKLFVELIENDYFKLTSAEDSNMFNLLRQILLGSVNKENITVLDELVKKLAQNCKSEDVSDITDNKIQALFLFSNTLSSIKKNNLASDLKEPVSNLQISITQSLIEYFNNIKWKRLHKKVTKNDANTTMELDRREVNAYLNSLLCYSAILSEEISKTSNAEALKKISKALNFFIEISLSELLVDNITLHHSNGCCSLINIVLKHFKKLKESISYDEESFHTKVWLSSKHFLKTSHNKTEMEWSGSVDSTSENVTLIFETCSVKFFNSFLMKNINQFNDLVNDSNCSVLNEESHVMKTIWSCFLNADLTVIGKTEARSAAVRKTVKNIFLCLQNMSPNIERNLKTDDDTLNQECALQSPTDSPINKNLHITYCCLDIIAEFIVSKKINSFNTLIDTVLQIPIVVNFDLLANRGMSLDEFCTLFDKLLILLNKLLNFRLELLQDRLPTFLQSYRKLLKILSSKSNSEHITDKSDTEKLAKLGLGMERITRYIVKNDKQDISRIASYIVSDIVTSYQRVSICQSVKFHLQNCAYCLMQILDGHSIGFMMRNMSDTSRIMFQQLYDNYKKYYKYKGMS